MVELRSEAIGIVKAHEVTAEFNRLYEAMKLDAKDGFKVSYEQIRDDLAEEVVEYSCDECGCEYDNEFDAECCSDIEDEEY